MKHLLLVHPVASSHLLYHSVASRPQNALLLPCPKNLANLRVYNQVATPIPHE